MKRPAGWEKSLLITLFLTLFLIFMTQIPAMALFGPQIVDVTTKAFSVVWTTAVDYTSCGINLYTSNSYSTLKTLDPSQIIIETDPNFPGEAGKNFRIAKVTVVGLNVDTVYYFRLKQNGSLLSGNYSVRTAKLRGLDSTEPNDNDIVSNDIVHKAVYKPDGSPATGTLVLADIYEYNVNPESAPTNTKSYYPVSAWVGDGMIGNENDTSYNPNNISYLQYAALNLNNLFEKATRYPLSLNGDDPNTTANDSEIIKFTIVHGTQPILGSSTDPTISYGRVEYVEKSGGEKITTAKISASFKFQLGGNPFAFPFTAPPGYTTGDLLKAIEEVEGETGVVKSILSYPGKWNKTYQKITTLPGGQIITQILGSSPLPTGAGCFIIMNKSMTHELIFYGKPDSVSLSLTANAGNLISIPQIPLYYETKDLLLDIEGPAGAGDNSVKSILSYPGKWNKTYKKVTTLPGGQTITQVLGSVSMPNNGFAFVILNQNSTNVVSWMPFD